MCLQRYYFLEYIEQTICKTYSDCGNHAGFSNILKGNLGGIKDMIKIENWSTENIEKYSRLIGEAFAASPGIAETIPHDDLVKSFEIITEFYYRMGTLYTTSEKYEGFLAYWDKKTRQPLGPALHMIRRMLREIPFKSLLNIATGSNEQYKKLYRKEKDYIAVSMVVVLQAYQGQGFMKKVLELPFAEAAKRGCPCILDTDNIQKVVKYEHCGMTKTAEKKMAHDITLYTMAYLPTSA